VIGIPRDELAFDFDSLVLSGGNRGIDQWIGICDELYSHRQ
jgi:hypothetical protein